MKTQTYLIDGFEYQYEGEIIGIIVEDAEGWPSFIFKPDSKCYEKLQVINW